MRKAQVFFGLFLLAATLVVGTVVILHNVRQPHTGDGTPAAGTPLPAEAIVVEVHSSDTKQDWMDQEVASFNALGRTINGHPVVVTVVHVGSGTSMNDILDGKAKPVVWSPGSSTWVSQINQTWMDRTGKKLISGDCPATLNLPLAIAMWRPMAEALGWPNKAIGWDDLAALSNNPQGWGAYGHPEWGEFKFGHPHPEHSNSGLLSLIAEVYAAANMTDGLTAEIVKSSAVMNDVGAVEQRVFHYGKKDTDLLLRMTQRGPGYLHAVTSYEANVIKWNRDHASELRFPLVAIYPADGTFWVDNPFCIVDGGDWVSAEQQQGAVLFRDYLLSDEEQAKAIDWGLRPADPNVPLHAPIDLEHGAVPEITMDQVPSLAYPSDQVVGHILEMWHDVKKKTTVLLLLDTSGSMGGDKIGGAVEGAATFVEQMDPADEVYVMTFADQVTELPQGGPVGQVGESLVSSMRGLYAEGNTALYQAVVDGLDRLEALKAEDEKAGERRMYGIVLLSDGNNTVDSSASYNDMLSRLPSGEVAGGVKIYTIAYGDDADLDILLTLANRTNGKQFKGDVEDIKAIYFLISSEF